MLAVEIIGLTKDYLTGFWRKRPRRVLDGLCLQVEAGQVFGLLGQNGAGKTTTLKLLLRLIYPTAGSACLLGRDFRDTAAHRNIGYLPENPHFYEHLTAQEFMHYAAALFGLSGGEQARRASFLLERVGLSNSSGVPLRKFSKGMIQRLGIAQALVNDPDLIFLDEPMSGLDPVGRREVRNLILDLKQEGKTIFFSTHILSDAETLCDRVAILDHGRLQGCGELREILKADASGTEIVLEKPGPEIIGQLEPLASSIVRTGNRVHLVLHADVDVTKILSAITRLGVRIVSLNPVQMSLEDYFMERVGNSAEILEETPAAAKRRGTGK